MADKTLIPAELNSDKIIVVPIVDLDGSAVSQQATTAAGMPGLTDALKSVNAFAERLQTSLDAVAPDKAKVEFSIGFTMQDNKITAMLVDGKSDGTITITMEWDTTTA